MAGLGGVAGASCRNRQLDAGASNQMLVLLACQDVATVNLTLKGPHLKLPVGLGQWSIAHAC